MEPKQFSAEKSADPRLTGFLLLNKPRGLSSAAALRQIKASFPKKTKIGHAGTLDPLAEGLLIVALGTCTRLIPYLPNFKTYRTTIIFGQTTPTLDSETDPTEAPLVCVPTEAELTTALQNFRGKIQQTPPQFSACKQHGVRAYALARQGKTAALSAKETVVQSLEVLDYQFPKLTLELTVQTGFYVRAFARDLAKIWGGGAYCESIIRCSIGDFLLSEAQDLSAPKWKIHSPQQIFPHWKEQNFSSRETQCWQHGRYDQLNIKSVPCFIKNQDQLLGAVTGKENQERRFLWL